MSESTSVIICLACGTKNRVDLSKIDKKPTCGDCKAPLPVSAPMEVGDDDFDQVVLKSELPVLVDFWAPWCGPCRMVGPVVEQLAQEYAGRILVAKLNTDDNSMVASTYKIMSIPTLMLFKGGEVIERVTGAVPKAHLEDLIRKHLQDS